MSTHFPDDQSIGTVLALANRAPSVHNCQPWRWRVGDASLQLYADPHLKLDSADPDRRELIISCGAALHHCMVALAALDWGARVHRFPDPTDPDHVASVEVFPSVATQLDFALAAAIPIRRTDRRVYSAWPVPRADIQIMGTRATQAGVSFRRVEALAAMNWIVGQAVSHHAADSGYLGELSAWSGRHGSAQGVPAHNVPPSEPSAVPPGRRFAGAALAMASEAHPSEDAAVVVGLSTDADDAIEWLRTGEATSVVLLTATALGMASCPVSEPLEIVETREQAKAQLFDGEGFPQMLLRIGWAPVNADPLPATPRRPLSEVVTRLDGSPFDAYWAR